MTPIIIFLITLCGDTLASDLFTIVSDPQVTTDKIAACQSEDLLSCSVVEINFSALDEESLTLPGDTTVTFIDKPGQNSYYFADTTGTEATFTRGETLDGSSKLIGNVLYSDGRDFTLEPCKAFVGCHVWMEEDETNWVDEKSEPLMEAEMRQYPADPAKIQQGKDDSTTIVTYSVMFYYTPEFAAITDDIPMFVSQVIAETNQGYINSRVPLRVKSHCIAAASLRDNYDSSAMLNQFSNYKPITELRNSADAAALLVKKFDSCGIGRLNGFMYGYTTTATQKSCALGYYSFGHELGHNFGAMHDARQSSNPNYAWGLGKHISGPNPGVRTIMAYNAPGHQKRINWWSNPYVTYKGYPTGTSGENNARVLREHRFAFAAIGDERNTCGTTNPTSTRGCPTKTNGGTSPGRNCVFPFEYKGQYFNHCQQYEGQYWCSTTSRYQKQWAYCNERACPLAQGCPTKTSGGTDPGSRCVFPFEYDGEQFNRCQKYLFRYWCSTTSTYQNKWAYCNEDVCPLA